MKNKICVDCKMKPSIERKRCRGCVLIFNRDRVKKYSNRPKKRYGIVDCIICGDKLVKGRPNQVSHGKCQKKHKTIDNYNNVPRSKKGNTKARQLILDLGINMSSNMVVHHIDENVNNNELDNFFILSRSNHAKLHRFLEKEWQLFLDEKCNNVNNVWGKIIKRLTKTWIQVNNITVITINKTNYKSINVLKEHIYRIQ